MDNEVLLNEVLIDEKSGISIEEQKEILTQINGIAEKNRRSLSGEASIETVVKADKNGVIFPVIINLAAAIVLIIGSFVLVSFNGKVETQVRTGNSVYNLTERALIDEIRRNTSEAILEKENEIASIASRLEEVDDELLQLYSSNLELTAEQRIAQNRLLNMQNAFREELSILQDERSQILENSRSREARLRAQMEERAREFAAAQQMVSSELDSAKRELERLTSERERIDAVNSLFSGGFAVLNEKQTVQAGNADQFELMARNAQLQDNLSELQKTIDALSSGGSGLTLRISQLEQTISALQNSSAEKDTAITSLENDNTHLNSTVAQLRTTNTAQEQEITSLRNQITVIRQALMDN